MSPNQALRPTPNSSIRSLIAVVTLTFIVACSKPVPMTGPGDFVVEVGAMKFSFLAGTDRFQEAESVPLDPQRRPGFCFRVTPPDDRAYEVYSIAFLPGEPVHIRGKLEGLPDDRSALRSSPSYVYGTRRFCFDFDRGDPLGEYRIEVFINGARHTELRLQVVR